MKMYADRSLQRTVTVKNLESLQYLWLTPLGAVFFHSLYCILKYRVVPKICSQLSPADKTAELPSPVAAEISEKLVSIVYASMCSVVSLTILWQAQSDILLGQAPVLIPFTYFIVWYFVYDFYAMYDSYYLRTPLQGNFLKRVAGFFRANTAIAVHHVVIVVIGVPLVIMYAWRRDLGDFIIGCFMVHDTANPFLHTTLILKLLNRTRGYVFKLCAIMTVCSYFVFRLLIYPLMIGIYCYQYNRTINEALSVMKIHCHAFLWSAFALQVYWFHLIIRVYIKFLNKRNE